MSNDKAITDAHLKAAERFKAIVKADPSLLEYMPSDSIKEAALSPKLSLLEMIDFLFGQYGERTALAERAYDVVVEQKSGLLSKKYRPDFSGITYTELLGRIHGLANAWAGVGGNSGCQVKSGEFVCIIGFASIDFQVIDMACLYAQAVTVPLQSATSGADLKEIFENTNPAMIAATVQDLKLAASHAIEHGNINSLMVFDYEAKDASDKAIVDDVLLMIEGSGLPINLWLINDLVESGRGHRWQSLPPHEDGDSRLAAIIHSSGSTGKPKGAMLVEKAIHYSWRIYLSAPIPSPTITVTYAPLNHLMGRNNVVGALAAGGTSSFTLKPDMSTLFEDVRIVEPTRLSFFPRVFEMIYQHYQSEVTKRVSNGEGEERASALVKTDMGKHFLGGRLLGGIVGGAPTSPAVRAFMRECFDFTLRDGYGNTESGTGGIAVEGIIQSPPVTEYKLRDVPELGYYLTDKPFPRGELCYKSEVGILGYYKQPEATADLFDEDGFSLTGDIVEERGPNHVVVIDRCKDVLKLSQGEYVALGRLAVNFESGSPIIRQLYLHGNSLQAYLVGVVVPDFEAVEAMLGDGWTQAELVALLRSEMQKVAVTYELKSFEVPRDFIIENEAFSQENGLLSSVRKRLGPALKKKYGERLDAIYLEHERRKESELASMKDTGSSLTVLQKLTKLIGIELSIDGGDFSKPRTWSELGGDSMGAVSFSLAIESVFGVTLPADSLMSPTGSLIKWAKEIEVLLDDSDTRPTFDRVHGKGATEIHVKDLQLEKFLDEDVLAAAGTAGPVADQQRTILLTGANGFLGRIVCLQWMEKVAKIGGKVICLVRGFDNNNARQRLDDVFSGASPEYLSHYNALAEKHLEVLAGDFGQPLLGLDEATFQRLTDEVDRVCHVGALVNHRLSYQNLFGPNVAGTAEIIRLAITGHFKPVDFVSSLATLSMLDTSNGNEDALPFEQNVPLSESYAMGYAISKWAGECLLRKATNELGLEVNILRGPMMLPHQHFSGVINTSDMFTRLLYSLIVTGLAPKSFYPLAADGSRVAAHYEALPVDVVAAAVIATSASSAQVCRAFNITNYHVEDGNSLDTFVDWIESAGYPIARIDDHGEWFKRFSEKLNSLPEQQKQRSAVDITGAYAQPHRNSESVQLDCDGFRSLANDLSTGADIPSLNEQFVHKCLGDLLVLGFIEAP